MTPCNKIPYPNRKEAVAAKNSYNKAHAVKAKSVYRCPYCKSKDQKNIYHFTTQNRADCKHDRKYHIIQAELLRKAEQIW